MSNLMAFIVAPLLPSFFILCSALLMGKPFEGFWWMMIVLPISYITSFTIGFPVHLILVRFNRRYLADYIIAGAAASVVPIFVIFIFPWAGPSSPSDPLSSLYPIMGLMIVAGAMIGGTFWAIARPDKAQR